MAKHRERQASMPRRWRLPNPPPVFAGRAAEVRWLADAVERGPVSVVTGPAGIGKTALVHHALAPRRPDVLHVAAPSTEPAEQTATEVVRALASCLDRDVALAPLQSDFGALVDVTLELGAAWDHVVVIDGLATHQALAERWLDELAAHAVGGARFVITGRATPRVPQLAGQILALGALDPASARELAEAWAPLGTADARVRAARRSHGHPGRLQAILRGPASTERAPSEEASRVLRLLAATGQAMDARLLDAIGSPAAREELVAAGLLRTVGEAYEAWHQGDAIRATPEELERAAMAMVLKGGVDATLAAVGMLARAGSVERVVALLDERGNALLRDGYAAQLWAALGDLASSALEGWQLRCAAQLGNPTALARAHEPGRDAPADRLVWASTLLARGKPAEAAEVAGGIVDEGGPLAVEAACVAAEAHARLGDVDSAVARLDGIAPGSDERDLAQMRIARARWAIERGDAEASVSLGGWTRSLERMDAPEETWRHLAEALERRGELDAALEALDAMESRPRGARPELLASRMGLLVRARIAVERGEPELAQELVEVLRPFAREPSALAAPLTACELRARLSTGHLEGLEDQLELGFQRCRDRDALTLRSLQELAERLARASGREPETEPVTPGGHAWHARWGRARAQPAAPWDHRDEVWSTIIRACAALAAGRGTEALGEAQRAVTGADRWTLAELGLEARALCGEALVACGNLRGLRELAEDLAERATLCRSPRFERFARFFAAVARGRLDPATAEVLAADMTIAPTVARWARVALGGDAPLDRADRVLLDALHGAGAVARITREGEETGAWTPAWGVDLAERTVWLPTGERISLGGRPTQWRILETLARSQGLRADKETIVQTAWEVDEYHPGRHDGRLYVAIRKLRAVLEDAPSDPARLVTTEDGYALGRPVRLAE